MSGTVKHCSFYRIDIHYRACMSPCFHTFSDFSHMRLSARLALICLVIRCQPTEIDSADSITLLHKNHSTEANFGQIHLNATSCLSPLPVYLTKLPLSKRHGSSRLGDFRICVQIVQIHAVVLGIRCLPRQKRSTTTPKSPPFIPNTQQLSTGMNDGIIHYMPLSPSQRAMQHW